MESPRTPVRAVLVETGKTLEAALEAFFRHGIRLNSGFGNQVALPLGWWQAAEAARVQGALF